MKRKILIGVVIVFAAVVVGFVVAKWEQKPPPPQSPEEIISVLRADGLDYDYKKIGYPVETLYPGCHLKPIGDPRSWKDLASVKNAESSPRHIIICKRIPGSEPVPGIRWWGKFYFLGDPAEIDKIIKHLP